MWSYWQVCGPRNITTKYRELISGPSGKSSLIATLLRVLDMDDDTGTIYIDGLNIREISRETIRERIITVPQEPFLKNRSCLTAPSDAIQPFQARCQMMI